ncbi:MAG: aspartate--tRNA(Asn) ligase [Candidatus Bathyarchaeia archaeon]
MWRTLIKEARGRIGEELTLAGWVARKRDLGKILFFLLRDASGVIQVTVKEEDDPEVWRISSELGREDVVKVRGYAKLSEVSHAGIEFIPEEIEVLNKAASPLPFDPTEKVKAELDTRLDHRFLDFRTPHTSSIFKIQNQILRAFREFLLDRGFTEIQPPCIISSSSEGGAELFKIPYFEREAYLAQSPQLYKQMCAISFEKVFTVVPVWRAEKFNRPTHLNEIRQMDVEVAFASDEDVMRLLEESLLYILESVKKKCSGELEVLERRYEVPSLPLQRVTYTEAVELLRESGEQMEWGEDFSKPQERLLLSLVGEEAFFIKDWPTVQKPFYVMPYEGKPEICHAFDLLHEGLEISSGTQRIHLPELLKKQILAKGLDPKDFEYYINCFAYGAPPHAGWSIGLERLTMTVTGMENIRECCMFPRDRNRLVP